MDHSMDSSVVSEGVRSPDLSNQSVRRISPASSFALHSSSELNPSGESAWFVGEDASASVNPQGIDNYGDRIGDQGKPRPPETAEACHHVFLWVPHV